MTNALQTWLETATHNLAPRAVTQISNEITAHVQSAASQHQLEGMGEDEALELAVRELGSAKAAARGYRRAHLTVGEFKALSGSDIPVIVLRGLAFVAFTFAAGWQVFGRSPQLELAVLFSGQAVFNVFLLWAERYDRFEHKAFYQFAAITALFMTCVFGIIYTANTQQQMPLSFVIFGATIVTGYAAKHQWMTWQKLRVTSS